MPTDDEVMADLRDVLIKVHYLVHEIRDEVGDLNHYSGNILSIKLRMAKAIKALTENRGLA
jgi:hypothetical protein